MTSLLAVIRHGPTEWNELGKIQGRTDIPLSERGKCLIQQLQLPDFFSEMDWITSPLSRAIETGKLLGITEMLIDDRLIETNWGDWEGQVLQDLRVKYGQKMLENEKRGLDLTKVDSPFMLMTNGSWNIDVNKITINNQRKSKRVIKC